ncbi:MAG: E2 ligase fold family C protein [Bacteroidales bacterium]
MAIAKYFSKDLLAINQLLKGTDKNLEDFLLKIKVGVAFDTNATKTKEGNKALDISVRLLSRLYPVISIIDLSNQNIFKVKELKKLAESINSNIEFTSKMNDLNVLIIAGYTEQKIVCNGSIFYFGSDNWNAKFSSTTPQSFNNSINPFGCGISACIVVSNVFRLVFKVFIPENELDNSFIFSTLNYSITDTHYNPILRSVTLKDNVLVGLGAIGNGTIWALSNLPNIKGTLDMVDSEEVSLSNLQRYIMFSENDISQNKVDVAAKHFKKNILKAIPYNTIWAGYLSKRKIWNIKTVAVAIDNKKDRIGIQSSLPKKIFNSYTESNLLGIARHLDFLNSACLACGYIPSQKERNYINEVADNCNIPNLSNAVKDYINLDLNVDTIISPQNTSSLLDFIAQANNIERSKLVQFHGKKVNQFYSEFICGGISLSLSDKQNKVTNVDAPLAFQSAMAGILLAAELVIDESNLRKTVIKQQSHIYPLNPLGINNPFNHQLLKDNSGRCLCSDLDFKNQYLIKWNCSN